MVVAKAAPIWQPVSLISADRNRGEIMAVVLRQLCDRLRPKGSQSTARVQMSVENSAGRLWMVSGYRFGWIKARARRKKGRCNDPLGAKQRSSFDWG
jgi:hypothetical protein